MTAKAAKKAKAAPKKKASAVDKDGAPTNWLEQPSQLEIAFCHILIGQTKRNAKAAARSLGLQERLGNKMLEKERVKRYIDSYYSEFIRRMAEREVSRLVDAGITRDRLATRLMELADMTPERTRGTITGQVDAVNGCAALMGYTLSPKDDFFKGKSDQQIQNYADHGSFDPVPEEPKPTVQ